MTDKMEFEKVDQEKVAQVGEKIGREVGEVAGKAGEVVGDVAKIAAYGSVQLAKIAVLTTGSFAKGLKRGFKNK
ncbi:hypothetical protein [Listeria costaricensis]|uniref:hypothetical protein n=1 Tax=Listeria costaricensis TaxID=2026604 RepID=UPI000C06C833|nr:hypothetical protein [Listeria costaricensis]